MALYDSISRKLQSKKFNFSQHSTFKNFGIQTDFSLVIERQKNKKKVFLIRVPILRLCILLWTLNMQYAIEYAEFILGLN